MSKPNLDYHRSLSYYAKIIIYTVLFMGLINITQAHQYKLDKLEIIHPWSFETADGARVGAGYLTIINHGETADRLLKVTTELSNKTQIHTMSTKNGIMEMHELTDGLEIGAGQTVKLAPHGFHIMFMDLTNQLKPGQKIKATLTFAKAGKIEVFFYVQARDNNPQSQHDMHH